MSRAFLVLIVTVAAISTAQADGGTVRVSERVGPYRVSAFTSPVPLRAGPVDVSVLVQDADTGRPIPDVTVTVGVAPRERPKDAVTHSATTEAATNKLFRDALFDLPEVGTWDVVIEVSGPHGPATTRFAVEVSEPLPAIPDLAVWIGWPAVVVGIFVLHRLLVQRKTAPKA
jgi:hypothetical protein